MTVSLALPVTVAQFKVADPALTRAACDRPLTPIIAAVRRLARRYLNPYTNHAHGAPAP
ncbi:hypothetical protein D3C81_2292350 [compost metagenome]